MAEAILALPTIRHRLGHLAGRRLTDADCARLAFFAGMHDAGKVNRRFRDRLLGVRKRGGHIGPIWKILCSPAWGPGRALKRQIRTALGSPRWRAWFADSEGQIALWNMVLAHHGFLPSEDERAPVAADWNEARDGYEPLVALAILRDTLAAMFPESSTDAPEVLPTTPRFLHGMAGLVTLADWLGSDETIFRFPVPANGVPTGTARIAWARVQADSVVRRRWLDPSRGREAATKITPDFRSLFRQFTEPNPAQSAMLSLDLPEAGQITILEAETGSGKTEAALIHFLRLFREGEVDGLYFALPTRAAAVQIHRRIHDTLRCWLGSVCPPVGLAVPGYLRVDDRKGEALPESRGVLWPDGTHRDRTWAVENAKRYLSGSVMVGTLDQALLGCLRVRHAQFRSGPMLRLLLCVDEVHASDAYMTTLLHRLLDQHSRAGGHALLMSATLGTFARMKLLHPSGRVHRSEEPSVEEAASNPYPAVHRTGSPTRAIARDGAGKRVWVELRNAPTLSDSLLRRLKKAAESGAAVLLIRNTVDGALDALRSLEEIEAPLLRCQGVIAPHHGRFAPDDRRLLDVALEEAFRREDRPGIVAVTTQTAEQSLDICADWLVTDLAPADVLLQRIGRLHRHPHRERPPGFDSARVTVLAPGPDELAAGFDERGRQRRGRRPLGLGSVYPNVVSVLSTRDWLSRNSEILIPTHNRALVEAATHEAHLRGYAESLGRPWPAHLVAVEGEVLAMKGGATSVAIAWEESLIENQPLPDQKASTRLGLRDRIVDFPSGLPGPFGHPVSRIRLPEWMLRGVADDATLADPEASAGGIRFRFGGVPFDYSRLGLARRTDE